MPPTLTPLSPTELAEQLSGFTGEPARGPGTDTERRAALWLAEELRGGGREVLVEPFWCRPSTALTHALHAGLGLAGSLVSVHNPKVGIVLLAIAVLDLISDALLGVSVARRLTPERASQNIIALPPRGTRQRRVALIVAANYDAERMGMTDREFIRRPFAILRSFARGAMFGWLGWTFIALLWLLGIAITRYETTDTHLISFLQLIPTVGLVVALAMLAERALSPFAPGAGDNASGVATAVALARALDVEPLQEAAVTVLLSGGGDRGAIGLRNYLRSRRKSLRSHNTVVLGIGPCTGPIPCYFQSDGSFVPVRYFKALRKIGRETGALEPDLGLERHQSRGAGPALAARFLGIPAITVGSLDVLGLSPHASTPEDTADKLDPEALERSLQVALLMADGIDCFLADFAPQVAASAERPRLRDRIGAAVDWAGRPTFRRARRPRAR